MLRPLPHPVRAAALLVAPWFAPLGMSGCGQTAAVAAITADGGPDSSDAATCPSGQSSCGGRCVDTSKEPAHCGACGASCKTAEVCSRGTCAVSCSNDTKACGSSCVTVASDVAHCGACDIACKLGEVCSQGSCSLACSGGTTRCGDTCVDTRSDPRNCGACGTACPSGNVCSGGTCALSCGGGTTKCGTACVSPQVDPSHCGTCGNQCPIGQVCSGGACALHCAGGTTKCGASCVDTKVDSSNCGSCGALCPGGAFCANSRCTLYCQPPLVRCSTLRDAGADSGGGGSSDAGIPEVCADLQSSNVHCGSCGNTCGIGFLCRAGACVPSTYGSGVDGPLTVSGTVTIDETRSPASGTAGSRTLTVTTPFAAAGRTVLIHQTQADNGLPVSAGTWELNYVASTSGATMTLLVPLKANYTLEGNARAQVVLVPEYTTVSVPLGTTLTAPAWDGSTGGILVFQANVSLNAAGTLTMSGRGFRGPLKPGTASTAARQGEGPLGEGLIATQARAGGGGGGGRTNCECCWGGSGGGGGHGLAGSDGRPAGGCQIAGSGGLPVGDPQLDLLLFGGAGGAGGADEDGYGGDGGHGGGIVLIAAQAMTVTGSILAEGLAGGPDTNFAGCGSGGGGGGAGGAIFLTGVGDLGANLVRATGGAGGDNPGNCGQPGGAGAVGRIRGVGTLSGTTIPSMP